MGKDPGAATGEFALLMTLPIHVHVLAFHSEAGNEQLGGKVS